MCNSKSVVFIGWNKPVNALSYIVLAFFPEKQCRENKTLMSTASSCADSKGRALGVSWCVTHSSKRYLRKLKFMANAPTMEFWQRKTTEGHRWALSPSPERVCGPGPGRPTEDWDMAYIGTDGQ